ncbi:MAG: tricorn protease [Nocardioidaceae bacterium]|nr:tricorn protease [Nocardioidaceae bacterium]
MTTDGYLRYPHVRGSLLTFVAEDDVWLADTGGGRAYRLSADSVPALTPRISPDGSRVAWAARRDGATEVYVAPTEGGASRRLTYWGQPGTRVTGWVSDAEVMVLSTVGESEWVRMCAHAVPVDGGPSRRLPYGWVGDVAVGPDGGVLLSSYFWTEPARWKRYRGGTASQLWLDLDGSGVFRRTFADLTSSLAFPVWTTGADGRQRIAFCSDHEGRGQLYSAVVGKRAPTTARLARRTDGDHYARHASSDGRQVVYCAGGELYLLDSLDDAVEPRPIDLRLGGARPLLRPQRVKAGSSLGTIRPDRTGRASAVESRGTVSWVSHRGGPVRALAAGSAVRRRLPVVLDDARVAWVSDVDGDDALEILDLDAPDASPRTLVAAGRLGRVLEVAGSPDGRRIALSTHDGRILVCAVPSGRVTRAVAPREVDSTTGDMSGLAFSPDSRWLAWSASGPGPWEEPGPRPLRQIKLADLDDRRVIEVTPLRFTDTNPVFTPDGKHLVFLSVRSLDPVYDSFSFDLSFPAGCRPHLVGLAAETPSPFDPVVGGRPLEPPAPEQAAMTAVADAVVEPGEPSTASQPPRRPTPPRTTVDAEDLDQRVVPVPVEAGRYSGLAATKHGLVWLREPLRGELGANRATVDAEPERARVEHFDLRTCRLSTVVATADRVAVTGDGSRLVVVDKDRLSVVPSDKPAPKEGDDEDVVLVDLDRLRVEVDPPAEWRQMLDETWRLMRDHFWREDMGGVDWRAARDRYEPVLDRLGSHDDLIDVIWEMQGELGSSHAYAIPPQEREDAERRQGLLGADLEFSGEEWRITRIVPGDSSNPNARSPLLAPGIAARAGDEIVAVDGRRTSRTQSPMSLLAGTAGQPVELTLRARGRGRGDLRRVVVVPLAEEFPLRYQDWVRDRREYVHARTDGTIGYLHVPDMMSLGWAQLHRDLRPEMSRDGLIVDVRGNGGGHTSQLVLEKLARTVIGWDVVRGYSPESYPSDARRGPMVAIADMFAGSDGDIITAAIQSLELGPVVGTRTWGGVIGIDGRYTLVDGTMVTQPRYSFWFEKFGWGVENHGVDPDIEVPVTPQDRAAGNDVQLDRALAEIQRLLKRTPPVKPPTIPDLPGGGT